MPRVLCPFDRWPLYLWPLSFGLCYLTAVAFLSFVLCPSSFGPLSCVLLSFVFLAVGLYPSDSCPFYRWPLSVWLVSFGLCHSVFCHVVVCPSSLRLVLCHPLLCPSGLWPCPSALRPSGLLCLYGLCPLSSWPLSFRRLAVALMSL